MNGRQGDLFIANDIDFSSDSQIIEEIKDFDIDSSSPMDAFKLLIELKKKI